jgi:hypothetical protein
MFVHSTLRSRLWRMLLIVILCATSGIQAPVPASAQVEISAAPVTLVSGGVTSFTTDGPLAYWVSQPFSCSPGAPQATTIKRTRTTGWEERTVFTKTPAAGEPCPYQIYSNIVADATHLYWVDTTGVVRFPIAGSPTAQPEGVLNMYYPGGHHELAISDVNLWGYTGGHLWGMEKANPGNNFAIVAPDSASNLQWDGKYLYLIRASDKMLQRFNPQGGINNIDSPVTTYAPVGQEVHCLQFACSSTEYVYYVKQNWESAVQRYDIVANAYVTAYVSSPPAGTASRIYAITTGLTSTINYLFTRDVFFFEKQWVPCACFETTSTDFLRRLGLGTSPAETIDIRASTTSWTAANFLPAERFLLWKDVTPINPGNFGKIMRQPMNAETLPSINLRVTGYHITQGVQTPDNSIFLIRNRVTYFRLFVRSDGADVGGVTARLTAYWNNQAQGSIAPVRPLMTVKRNYSDIYLTNGFLFLLPREWLLHDDLRLVPVLNPSGVPLEPNFNDNQFSSAIGPFTIHNNPQARFHIVRMSYNWQGVNCTANDFDAIVSWLYRAYPIAIDPGQTAAGHQVLTNNDLAKRVRDFNNTKECEYLNDTKNKVDNRNLCGSYFLNDQMAALRRDGVLPRSAYIYASVVELPRGSAKPKDPVSNGPDLITAKFPFNMAGYYAGHEIGHLLGRGHPDSMSDNPKTVGLDGCGHDAGDPNFPYFFNWIGDPDNQVVGFDSGVGTPTGANRVMTYYDVREVMGYCNTPDQWLSDYTYKAIFNFLRDRPAPPAPNRVQGAANGLAMAGDWLDLSVRFTLDGPAAFTYVRRTDSVMEIPELVAGGYSLRLVNAGGAVLAEFPFTPDVVEDSDNWLAFAGVIPFQAGAAQVQLVDLASSAVLASLAISANAPQVSAVSLPGAVQPLQGVVPLNWSASDADGGTLTYELSYSVDGGETFELLQLGLTGTSTEVDTEQVPGGMGVIFRITASDGIHTGFADSVPMQVAVKAPVVHILTPANQQHVQYGTPLMLTGYALDAQDGGVSSEGNLTWSSQDGPLGAGPNVTVADLPNGPNTITLTAVNSSGLSGSASITVIVGDDLYEPPPQLSVAPGMVNLQVPGEAPDPQTTQLFINNGGGPGNMDWSASSNVAWLALDSATGSTPAAITVTATPDGLAPNSTHLGEITVVSGAQSAVVQVRLQIGTGSLWAPPPEAALNMIFLPLTKR